MKTLPANKIEYLVELWLRCHNMEPTEIREGKDDKEKDSQMVAFGVWLSGRDSAGDSAQSDILGGDYFLRKEEDHGQRKMD